MLMYYTILLLSSLVALSMVLGIGSVDALVNQTQVQELITIANNTYNNLMATSPQFKADMERLGWSLDIEKYSAENKKMVNMILSSFENCIAEIDNLLKECGDVQAGLNSHLRNFTIEQKDNLDMILYGFKR